MAIAFVFAIAALARPAWAGPPLSAYGGLPSIEDAAISPNGRYLAIVETIAGQRRLAIYDEARQVRRFVALQDIKLRYVRWAGDDTVVAVSSATGTLGMNFTTDKLEFYSASLLPIDNRKPARVFAGSKEMVETIFGDYGVRQIGDKWIGYFGGIELRLERAGIQYVFDHGRPALFRVDMASARHQKLAPAPPEGTMRDWLIDGAGAIASTLDIQPKSGRWWLRNVAGTAIATGQDTAGRVGIVSLGKDGNTVIYSQERADESGTSWYEVPLAGGAATEFLPDLDIQRIFVDPRDGRLLGYLENGPSSQPVLFDPARQATIRKVYRAFSKLNLRIVEWTPTFSHVLVHTSGNGDSGTWYVVDVARLEAEPVGRDYPTIPPQEVGAISTFAYQAGDGLALDGILTLPPGSAAKRLPVVVLPHGGPHAHDEVAFDWWAQAFASRGYAVFQPNFRGSTNRDEAFRKAGYGQWGRAMQTDISDGLKALAAKDIVDPARACIVGASYGGYAALAGTTLQQGLYRCAVAVAPVSDLRDMYFTDIRESGGSRMVKVSLKQSLGSPDTFAEVSPRRHAARADAPILLIHGRDDTVVPYRQSSEMADALKDAGKPHQLIELREEDHWLSRAATRQQMLEAAMAFVATHNPAN